MGKNSSNTPHSIERIQQWKEWDHRYIWRPFTQMQDYDQEPPLIISHGRGAYLYDIDGNRYFDGISSLWVNLHGHARPEITEAIARQAANISHSTLLGQGNIPSIELAKRLVDLTPPGLDKVFYSDNGSTANEVALKMAFQYWRQVGRPEKMKFVTFDGAYHGDTIGSVSLGGIDLFHGIFGPLLFKRCSAPYPVFSKYTSQESPQAVAQRSLDAVKSIFKQHNNQIAALIVEPLIQGASGIRTAAPGFLSSLRELCTRYDVLMICDEVFVGFGRTGAMFACEHESVSPDFLCLAKGISGGYLPLAATLTAQKIYDAFLGDYAEFKAFYHGHSYTGNQLGCSAALASLDIFETDGVLNRIKPFCKRLEERLDALFEQCDLVGDIHQRGPSAGIDIIRSRRGREPFRPAEKMGAKACLALRKHGIWLRPLGDTLVIIPPLVTTVEQIDDLMDAVEQVLKELQ
ncbi:MAG: adenosylmethionine--8-amino-7-oxononanoate transaminase [Candidatus Omnitrophica bacterium]|nr:adenosylmethionine--8-amino-7-oxononanoate transaminase [Candidatus Omnitrophota bacterium]